MKKNILFALLGIILLLTGCASVNTVIRSSGGATFVSNIVSSVTGLDLGPGTSVSIGNMTPFYTEVLILDKTFNLDPASFMHDSWHVEFDRSPLPVVVRFFSDRNRQNLVGVSESVLGISNNQPTLWLIRDVSFLDGSYRGYSYVSPYPQPDLGTNLEVDIPRIVTRSTNILQIVNGTLFDVVVYKTEVKGKISDLLGLGVSSNESVVRPGGIYRATVNDMFRNGRVVRLAAFVDRGRFVGYADPIEFETDPNGPRVRHVLLTPGSIRRQ